MKSSREVINDVHFVGIPTDEMHCENPEPADEGFALTVAGERGPMLLA